MYRWLLLCLVGLACAGGDSPPATPEGSPPAAPGAEGEVAESERMRSEAPADDALAVGRPLTLRLAASPELAEALRAAGDDRTLRLTLMGLENPGNGATVRVFVNRPDADASTPLDDPHYVGESTFFPAGDDAYGREDSFLFDAGRALEAMPADARVTAEGAVDVTLVLVPRAGPGPEGSAEISFDGVRLEAVDPEN